MVPLWIARHPCAQDISNAKVVAAGDAHTAILKNDGTVWTVGRNVEGQLGDGTTTNREKPVQVQGLNNVITIAAGVGNTVALKGDGTVWAWGYNNRGQVGDGTVVQRNAPVQVLNLTNVIAIAVFHSHMVALRNDGTVWTWGRNLYGELGDGTTNDRTSPVQVQNLTHVNAIAAGTHHTIALRDDGTVWAWGNNFYGQLGDGTTTDRVTPAQVQNLSNVTAVSAGEVHTVALRGDGTAWAWGGNEIGSLGNGTTTNRSTPVQMNNLTNVMAVSAGFSHTVVVRKDGTVWACGNNEFYRLGDETTINRNTAVQVKGPNGVGWLNIGAFFTEPMVAAGNVHTLALKSDGTVWAWGRNIYGQLGDNTNTNRSAPVQVQNLSDVVAVATGLFHSLALKSDGTVWAWGDNWNGQMGDNGNTDRKVPGQVQNLSGVIAIAGGGYHSLALKSDGTVWAWGENGEGNVGVEEGAYEGGQLGDGSNINRRYPVQVKNLSDVIAIAGGAYHSLALKRDGTVWAWGFNSTGPLGDGTTTNRNTPVQVQNLSSVKAISGGNAFSVALKSDGTVWAWGHNTKGQLGDNTNTARHSPVQVQSLSSVNSIGGGGFHCIASKSDGTVWVWGDNAEGQLGNNSYTGRSTPMQVQNMSGASAVSAGRNSSIVLKSDGTVWAWGRNAYGELGDNTTTSRLTPVQVVGPGGAGWFNVYSVPTSTHTVTYNYSENGGTSATKNSATVEEGAAIDLTPTAYKSDWAFVGWNTNKDAISKLNALQMGTSDVMLNAIYSKTLTGTFIDYSGMNKTTRTAQTTIYNKATNGSITTYALNTYTGWSTRGWGTDTVADASVVVAGNTSRTLTVDTTFYGLYQRTLTLGYNTSGGIGAPSNQSGTQYANSYNITNTKNPSITISNTRPILSGSTFIAWAKDSLTGTRYQPGDIITLTANTTLFAIWGNNTTILDNVLDPKEGTIVYAEGAGLDGLHLEANLEKDNFDIDDGGVKLLSVTIKDENNNKKTQFNPPILIYLPAKGYEMTSNSQITINHYKSEDANHTNPEVYTYRSPRRSLNHSSKTYDFDRVTRDDGKSYFILETDHLSDFEIVVPGKVNNTKYIFSTGYESTLWNWIMFIFLFGWIWMWF